MPKLKYIHHGVYRDGVMSVASGTLTPDLSDERASELLDTFPNWFTRVVEPAAKSIAGSPKNKLAKKAKDK